MKFSDSFPAVFPAIRANSPSSSSSAIIGLILFNATPARWPWLRSAVLGNRFFRRHMRQHVGLGESVSPFSFPAFPRHRLPASKSRPARSACAISLVKVFVSPSASFHPSRPPRFAARSSNTECEPRLRTTMNCPRPIRPFRRTAAEVGEIAAAPIRLFPASRRFVGVMHHHHAAVKFPQQADSNGSAESRRHPFENWLPRRDTTAPGQSTSKSGW
jgi:hypothetical protein